MRASLHSAWSLARATVATFVLLSVVTGVIFPLVVTVAAQVLFPHQANGSLIAKDLSRVHASADGLASGAVGSELIGQEFSSGDVTTVARYFWGRLSATSPAPYTSFAAATLTGSSGSNLAPSNPALVGNARARLERLREAESAVGLGSAQAGAPIPIDLVTASGSGLDPHISIAAAEYQVPRVAKARGLSESQVRDLVRVHASVPIPGLAGESAVNVLTLNCALDALSK